MRQDRWTFPSTTRPAAWNDATPATALATAGSVNASDYEGYGYDAAGNRLSLRKRDGLTLTYSYDNLNRLLVKTVPERAGLDPTHTRDVYYGYDLRNAQLYARFDNAAVNADGVTNVYDAFGRLTSSALRMDGVSRAVASLYREDGVRTRITHPGGAPFTYTYDAAGRPTGVYASADTSIVLATFTWNLQGLPATRSERYGSNVAWGYDPVGRPTSQADVLVGGVNNVSFARSYNPASQIRTATRDNDAYAWTGAATANRAYTTNGLNQYSNVAGTAFGYDANGNLTSEGARTFTYDVENRLVGATPAAGGTGTVALRYDPLGRLYEVAGPSGTRRFAWDGDALIQEYDTAGTMTDRYVHMANAGADDPLVWYDRVNVITNFLHTDQQGSVVALTGNGGASALNAYDEYGVPGAGNVGRFQYTGQLWLPDLGM
jgi:YD repeat-containing protein